jgi:hypothetical protein
MSGIFGDLIGGVLKGLAGQQQGQAGGGLGGILGQVLANTDLSSLGGLLDQLQKSGLGRFCCKSRKMKGDENRRESRRDETARFNGVATPLGK